MAFPSEGFNHHKGVNAEKSFYQYKEQLEILYGKEIIDVIHIGGTKTKTDNLLKFIDGTEQKVSLKDKEDVKIGSFDYANTTKFDKSLLTDTLDVIKKYRKSNHNILEAKEMLENVISQELTNKWNNDSLTKVFIKNVIEKYIGLDLIVADVKTNKIYKVYPEVFKLINEGYKLTLDKETHGKTSTKLLCVSENNDIIDLGLRIRIHLNNGYTKWLDKEKKGNSSLCLKFQQDSVYNMIENSKN